MPVINVLVNFIQSLYNNNTLYSMFKLSKCAIQDENGNIVINYFYELICPQIF